MRELRRSAIVPYSAESMFDLVADVDSYADFVPGCTDSCLESGIGPAAAGPAGNSPDEEVLASLGLAQGGFTGRFTTRNRLQRPGHIHMSLVDGPFATLEGDWRIQPLGDEGCRLELHMRFAFSNRMKDILMGPLFETTCNRLVDAFVKRAEQLYG